MCNLINLVFLVCFLFLAVFSAPGPDRKLGESQGIRFHPFAARSERIEPSYDPKRELTFVETFSGDLCELP